MTIVVSALSVGILCAIAMPELMPATCLLSGTAIPLHADIAVRMPANEPGPISTPNRSMSAAVSPLSSISSGSALKISWLLIIWLSQDLAAIMASSVNITVEQ